MKTSETEKPEPKQEVKQPEPIVQTVTVIKEVEPSQEKID